MLNKQEIPERVAQNIMKILHRHLRMPKVGASCKHIDDTYCFPLQYNKIKNLVQQEKAITFILPAFPAKSPNYEKTQGIFPDLGEHLALYFLNKICIKIKKIYAAGANIMICSDGRVFNDLVMVSDGDVNTYANEIKNIIKEKNLIYLSTFSLDDCYGGLSYTAMRDSIVEEHGEDLMILKNRVKIDESTKLLFNGIHRFIFEDRLVHSTSLSKNQIRQQSKEITYQVIQRSNAWSHLLKTKFPSAIRLSIHPQPCESEKLGIMLIESPDEWATPWHRVVLKKQNRFQLIKRKEAELLKAEPVFIKDQFSHYVI